MLSLISMPFAYVARKIDKHSVAETLMAPTISQEDLKAVFDELDRPTAPANRIEAGVPRHTWYANRFAKPKQHTPFQS